MIRDGKQQRIAGREVVRDDIVLIAEGDRIPADAALLTGLNVSVDESLLTGESVPVNRDPHRDWKDRAQFCRDRFGDVRGGGRMLGIWGLGYSCFWQTRLNTAVKGYFQNLGVAGCFPGVLHLALC